MDDLIAALHENADIADIREILIALRDGGTSAAEVEATLSRLLLELRQHGGKASHTGQGDLILDTLDIVTNYCSREWRVWQ